jgi:hypothetical protein
MSNAFLSRRRFLAAAGGAFLGGAALQAAQQPQRRPRVAAIYTVFRRRSHAFNILESFLRPYLFNGKRTESPVEVVSFFADQTAREGDLTQEAARQFKVPVYKSIEAALCLGGKQLAVDAVLSIGEHGDYPQTKLGQTEYPRKRFFDESVAVMRRAKRFVPLFNDKHLSYRWDWAREMYDTARTLGIPLMAGSSVPLAERRPALEIAAGAPLEEVVSVHGGGPESYDFHAFEVLQSLAEFRKGGETGISSVQFLRGDALMQAGKQGRFSLPLAEAALRAEFGNKVPANWGQVGTEKAVEPHGVLLTYRDGFRGTLLKVGSNSVRWDVAYRLTGDQQPRAFRYYVGPWGNRNLFMALSHAIQHHFVNRASPYPVERTLLASGVCDALMQSRGGNGAVVKTPHLQIAYAAQDFRAMRELGASWKTLDKVPEPQGLNPTGEKK